MPPEARRPPNLPSEINAPAVFAALLGFALTVISLFTPVFSCNYKGCPNQFVIDNATYWHGGGIDGLYDNIDGNFVLEATLVIVVSILILVLRYRYNPDVGAGVVLGGLAVAASPLWTLGKWYLTSDEAPYLKGFSSPGIAPYLLVTAGFLLALAGWLLTRPPTASDAKPNLADNDLHGFH